MTIFYNAVDPFNPAIDQPITIDFNEIDAGARFPLANTELEYTTDRHGDLFDLDWPWHERIYARSIQVRISAPIYTQAGISTEPVDDVMPLVVRFFPGYQETIYGTESGIIVSKRIFAPLGSGYDRSTLWLLECQAEGDRLMRIEIDIDWGMPVEQRMVDGLLVAQENPGEAQGMHDQQNAESTRIFGTDGGRPDWVHFPDERSAQLVYHLLVAGQVDLPLILTLSDVGEQVAWNGFLAQRDISRTFKRSQDAWTRVSRSGRLWTPHPPLNRAVQWGKEAAVQGVRRLRTGFVPADRQVTSVPLLVDTLDTFEPQYSRHLLDHLKRAADRSGGRLPVDLPSLPGPTPPPDPGRAFIDTNTAYLHTLANHLSRQPNASLLADQYEAAKRAAELLVQARREHSDLTAVQFTQIRTGLYLAARLAGMREDSANEMRWASEAVRIAEKQGGRAEREKDRGGDRIGDWARLDRLGAPQSLSSSPRSSALNPFISISSEAVWQGCGISVRGDDIYVLPQWPQAWGWWALLDLPIAGSTLSLLWDGEVLHSNRFVRFDGQVRQHERIRTEGSDSENFALRFVLIDGNVRRMFQPIFYEEESAKRRQPVRGLWKER